jgi:T-complex protein 1 subunit eta
MSATPHGRAAQLSRALREHARTIPGKAQLFINAFAKALEVRG